MIIWMEDICYPGLQATCTGYNTPFQISSRINLLYEDEEGHWRKCGEFQCNVWADESCWGNRPDLSCLAPNITETASELFDPSPSNSAYLWTEIAWVTSCLWGCWLRLSCLKWWQLDPGGVLVLPEYSVRQLLIDAGFKGWCTVEQDCDPTLDVRPMDDARANREYLESIGFK